LNQIGRPGQAGFGILVYTGEGRLSHEKHLSVVSDFFRENMGMDVDNHVDILNFKL
jgi:hypothetical protein